jgi:FtsP/CotA-like multicopper oxidase with cupredoxin domain
MLVTECKFTNISQLDFSECKRLKFSVIGSDGALFNTPVHDLDVLDMYSAERYDILIVFDGIINGQPVNPISAEESSIYLVTSGNTTWA